VKYAAAIKDEEFDIIHVHSPFAMGLEGLRIAHKQKIPIVATFHTKYYEDFAKIMKVKEAAKIGVRIVVGFYGKCDEVWAVNKYAADTLKEYGYKGEIIVMPNGTPVFRRDPADEAMAKARFSIKEGPVFLYVGQMNWKKNLLRTLEAASLLKKRKRQFQLIFAGQGPDLADIEAKAKKLGIYEDMVFTGHIEDKRLLKGIYQSADLLLFPSLYDTAPMVVREAASAGLASAVVTGSGPSEDITHGINGLVCDDTSESLAAVLEGIMGDRSFLKRIGDKARATIFMPWSDVVDMALARYESVIRAHGK